VAGCSSVCLGAWTTGLRSNVAGPDAPLGPTEVVWVATFGHVRSGMIVARGVAGATALAEEGRYGGEATVGAGRSGGARAGGGAAASLVVLRGRLGLLSGSGAALLGLGGGFDRRGGLHGGPPTASRDRAEPLAHRLRQADAQDAHVVGDFLPEAFRTALVENV